MDVDVDHYSVLGLPSGEEGAQLSEKEISKAYRAKALELHPDKRLDDPNAHSNFQKLKTSYEILKDEKARKLFDDLLRVKREQLLRRSQQDSKRRRMVSDLEERERAAFAPDSAAKAKNEEERILRKLREEIERIRAMHANKGPPPASSKGQAASEGKDRKSSGGVGLDKEKVLKVSWEMSGPDYTVERLKELFSVFGVVEDVVTRKKRSALVVMASKDAAVAATRTVCGDLSNPLLVVPLQPVVATDFPSVNKPVEKDLRNDLVGAGYQDFEDSVMKKLQKAAARQK
ncbi:dnaJ homolog subfamily C member 17 [Rhodamnia argentea]|uniref:DnaJ homolog subfamily C member 17 n=1 Tax=Rhodamnia argentea TaxID=178133 RepID=A0ABM3HDS7_9MYRT|nr:dnaJ homolog subfamily C member 17 [Rhodamnia argentea]